MAPLEKYPNVTNLSATLLVKNVCDYSGEVRQDLKRTNVAQRPLLNSRIMKEGERWLDSRFENNPDELYVEPKENINPRTPKNKPGHGNTAFNLGVKMRRRASRAASRHPATRRPERTHFLTETSP